MRSYILVPLAGMMVSACSGPMSTVGLNPKPANDPNNNTAVTAPADPQLQETAFKILATNCATCHGEGSGSANVHSLNNLKHMVASGLIVPGQPTKSPLYLEIQSGAMPPNGALPRADQDVIFDFISKVASSTPVPPATPPAEPVKQPVKPPVNPGPEPTFKYIQSQILVPKCVACHKNGGARGGYAFDTYQSTMKSINVKSPSRSKLYTEVQTGAMPPRPRPDLNSEELNLIITWIEKGALNN